MLNKITVGISDMRISTNHRDVLVTHSLGSCLGLAAFDPVAGVAGLIHCLLPCSNGESRILPNPYIYVNTGIPSMLRKMLSRGATRENLVLKLAGCARMLNVQNQFDTGAKNYAEFMRLMQKNGVAVAAEDTGGSIPRTMHLYVETGLVEITSCGKKWEL